ncbi:42_t:CDS:2 [Ambispora leptoticha]|uniref:42_t:CDS:1 n=1 Tax=Ambispora leptoticha TaxID=144679 RepID=A0A9N8Z037_9GLOM|nr:42_t:CDS:2 [Ambispora leptoticha]
MDHEEETLRKQNRHLFEELSQDNSSEDSYYQITTIDIITITDMTTADTIITITDTTNFMTRDKLAKLEAHLANEYTPCPDVISRYWHNKVAEYSLSYMHNSKNQVLPSPFFQIIINSYYISNHPLPNTTIH